MWLERIRLKRQLASADAAVRVRAVAALNMENDHALLLQLANSDSDFRVRSAAICRFADPQLLVNMRAAERDPQIVTLLAKRIDQLYAEQALQACAEERDCDAFDRIEDHQTLIEVALRSNSPALILAAGARLAPTPENWLKLLLQLTDDKLALELYERNMPEPDSAAAAELLRAARSQALRNAIAAEQQRRQELSQAYAQELALVEAAESCAELPDDGRFESLYLRFRQLPVHNEQLKNRFLAARYRFFRAQEELLARQETLNREKQLAGELTAQLEQLKDSGNWKAIRQVIELWNRSGLNNSPAAEPFRDKFNALAMDLTAQAQRLQQNYQRAVECAQSVLTEYANMVQSAQVPGWEKRQELLQNLEQAAASLGQGDEYIISIREKVLAMERELRRRSRQEAQERDLARWEHYTLKMDICAELEKLSQVPDSELGNAGRAFRNLRERWNAVGAVPNEKFEELRNRYYAACSALHSRLEQFFAERQAKQQQALETKKALLAEAETLSGSDDWSETSNQLKELQTQWKNAGSAGGAADRELFERFHAACDSFFVRRNSVWEERKKSFMAAARRKQELCAAAEALLDKPFAQARNEVAALREAWKNIPSAGKDDRLLYMQFNRAIDNIFAAYREAGDEARRRSEIICTDLAELLQQARSGALSIREIERAMQDNQRNWDDLDFRVANDVVKRREATAEELKNVLCGLHHQESMHKLDNAEQLESVIDNCDDSDKLIDHLGRRLKVCGELEERLRECRIIAGGGDLAGELQQAIAGNFGGDDYKLTIAELDEFLQRFVAVGAVPPDARSAVFDRFRTLYNRALTELQSSEAAAE